MLGDECFVGEHAVINPSVKVYPFKTVEAGAVVNSSIVWESRGAAHALRTARRARTRQRRHHARGRGPARDGLRHRAEEGLDRHDEPRHEPRRPRAEARDHRWAEPRRRDRRRRRAGDACRSPGSRCATARRRAASRCGSLPAIPTAVEIRFFDADGRDIDEAMQRKIERLLYAKTTDARSPATSATSSSRRGRSSSTRPRWSAPSNADGLRERAFKVVLDYSYGAASLVMPSVLAKLGAEVLAVNPYREHRVGDRGCSRTQRNASNGSPISSARRAASSGMVLDPDGETARDHRRRRARARHRAGAARARHAGERGGTRRPRSRCRSSVSREAERIAREHEREIVWTKLSRRISWRWRRRRRRLRRVARRRASSGPTSSPRTTPPRRSPSCSTCSPRPDRRCRRWSAALPRVHVAHEAVPTPWERKGAVMREMIERPRRTASSCSSTG